MAERPHVRYSALSTQAPFQDRQPVPSSSSSASPAREDLRFSYNPRSNKIPWKSIALALFLLAFGTLCLLLSYLIATGHMGGDSSQIYGFLTIGILLFLPGFYETRIAYYSMRGAKGYSYSQIPEY